MKPSPAIGTCNLCGAHVSRPQMTRHLKTCGAAAGSGSAFHLFVEARHDKRYWIHIAAPVTCRLSSLDDFLRRIWLECCEHLSAFTIGGERCSCLPEREWGESGMSAPLLRVVGVGSAFDYEYDFGSTTELKLKVLGLRSHAGKGVKLLARNDALQTVCDECGTGLATRICTECACGDGGWLCAACAAEHKCGEEMFLPVVNSPRVGVCAYCGPEL